MQKLTLEKFIGGGYSRKCFEHPHDPSKCIKIACPGTTDDLLREARIATLIAPFLQGRIALFDMAIVETNHGPGIVCNLVRDDNGAISKPLRAYKDGQAIDDEIVSEINEFTRLLIMNDIFFYDFNYGNFVIKKEHGRKRIIMVDLKSFNRNGFKGFLKLEYVFAPLARNIMFRRIRRILYQELGIEFPWEKLCREKRFKPLLVPLTSRNY